VSPCGVEIAGTLRDLQTNATRQDRRIVNLKPMGDGWVSSDDSDIATFANITVCPNQWSPSNVYGTEYELSVSVMDVSGRTASTAIAVLPACVEPLREEQCLCICRPAATLADTCEDAGTDSTFVDSS
jgi:hypothetical protein